MCCPGRASLTLCIRGLRAVARAVRVPRCKSRCFNAKLQQAPPKTARGGGLVVFLYRRRRDGASRRETVVHLSCRWSQHVINERHCKSGSPMSLDVSTVHRTPVPRFGSTGCAPEPAHCHFRRSTSLFAARDPSACWAVSRRRAHPPGKNRGRGDEAWSQCTHGFGARTFWLRVFMVLLRLASILPLKIEDDMGDEGEVLVDTEISRMA